MSVKFGSSARDRRYTQPNARTYTVSAPGNLFCSGEHATVYTKTALLVAPDVRTTVTVTESKVPVLDVYSHSLGYSCRVPAKQPLVYAEVHKKLVPSFKVVEAVCRDYSVDIPSIKMEIKSDIPVGGGLSSSTALLVAEYFAVAGFLGADPWKLSDQDVYDRLLPLQELIHGKASGMELFSSHLGGFNLVVDKKVEKNYAVDPREQPVCIIGDTGISRSTSNVVAMVSDWKVKHPMEAERIFGEIHSLTRAMDSAIDNSDWTEVGRLMTKNHGWLRQLGPTEGEHVGVSHVSLDAMVNAAIGAGAYGAKLSGAGWGGNMFAICGEDEKNAVIKAISKHGKAHETKLGAQGVRKDD